MKKPKRILICRPDRIGDVILSTPLIREIKISYPDSFIGVLVNPYTKDILKNNPNIDTTIIDNPVDRINFNFYNQVKLIRKYKFDTALMLLPTERLAWMLFLALIPKRIGVGTKLYQILTFTNSVSRNKYIPLRHEADYCMDLGRKIGVNPSSLDPEIFVSELEKTEFLKVYSNIWPDTLFSNGLRFIGIHPGSNQSAPNWTVEKYVSLASMLLEDKRNIIILTGSEKEMKFVPKFKSLNSERVINLIGKLNLRELCAAVSLMNVIISASTGPMHIAAALKVPTVSLFCTLTACSPALWGPLGNLSEIITPPDNFCRTECKDDPHNCDFKDSISVDTVHYKIKELLNITSVNEL